MKSSTLQNSFVRRSGRLSLTMLGLVAAILGTSVQSARAQATGKAPLPVVPRPPATESSQPYDSTELRRVLSPVALYPDPLLAQLLTAATFSTQVAEAARWRDSNRDLTGQALTDALAAEQVTWDPSVQAMLAFPTVLQMMAADLPWTEEVGDAFKSQRADVMDAVQYLRTEAQRYGYLRSNDRVEVSSTAPIEILPANPTYIAVPYYDPLVVFAPPRPRFILSSAIYFGYGVRLGLWFEPWGYGPGGFYWPSHRVVYGYPGWGRPSRYGSGYGHGFYYSPRYSSHSVRGSFFDRGGRSGDGRSGRVGDDRGGRWSDDRSGRSGNDRSGRSSDDRGGRSGDDRGGRSRDDGVVRPGLVATGREFRDEPTMGARRDRDPGSGDNSARGPRASGGRAEQGPSWGGSSSGGHRSSGGGRADGASTSRGGSRGSSDGRSSSRGGGSGRSGRSR